MAKLELAVRRLGKETLNFGVDNLGKYWASAVRLEGG